jgi:thioredoxin reductase (NADPH)
MGMFQKIVSGFVLVGFCVQGYAKSKNEDEIYPVVVLGGGIGALTSSLYLGRAELHPVVIEGQTPGGLLTQSHSVQNWPGIMEIEGHLLTENMRKQAEANGAQFFAEEVVAVDFEKRPFTITLQSTEGTNKKRKIRAESCIIAMGTEPNYLHIPGESGSKGYWGKGVSNCAICDGNLFRNRIVGVVGGGDAAVLEALYLSNIAKEVTVFVRKNQLKATEQKRIEALLAKPNIKIMYNTQVLEIKGDRENIRSCVIKTEGKKAEDFRLDGLFLAIGSKPNSRIFQGILELDSEGYIVVHDGQQTSVEGVYAVGDIVDPIFKQAISAAGDGAKAALQAQQYVSDRINHLASKTKPDQSLKNDAVAGEVIEILSQKQFESELENTTIPVVVDFYATWCGPCKRISPALETAAAKLGGKVKFLKVNVDRLEALSNRYNIRSMPTALLFDPSGDELDRKVGLGPITHLLQDLEE